MQPAGASLDYSTPENIWLQTIFTTRELPVAAYPLDSSTTTV
jgi:hypothetical protein